MYKKELTLAFIIVISVIGMNYVLVWAETSDPNGAIKTFGEAYWYMVVTLTTVGYGDLYPVSTIGKVIGYFYIFSSIGLLGLFLGTFTNKYNHMMEEKKLGFKGVDFENHLILVGWNDFSRQILNGLIHTDLKTCIITDKKDDVDLIYAQYKNDVFVLFTDLENLDSYEKVNAKKSRAIFISLENESQTLMHVVNFRKICPLSEIIVSATKSNLKQTFEAAGATHFVPKNEIASKLIASYIFEPDVAELNLDLLASSNNESDFDVMEFKTSESNPYLKLDAHEIFHKLKDEHDGVLMGIRKLIDGKRHIIKNPSKGILLEEGDYLIVMANKPIRNSLEDVFQVKEGA